MRDIPGKDEQAWLCQAMNPKLRTLGFILGRLWRLLNGRGTGSEVCFRKTVVGAPRRGTLWLPCVGPHAKRAVPYSHLQGARRWPKSSPPPSPPLSWLNALRTRLACLDLRLRASASLPGCAPVRHVRSGSWLFIDSKRAANSTSATALRVLCQRLPLRGLRGFRVYTSKILSPPRLSSLTACP